IDEFAAVRQDSQYAVMRDGELRFVPVVDGIEFNPPERRFLWTESVHKEEFRLRAKPERDGQTLRGTLTVFAGNLLLAELSLAIRVDSQRTEHSDPVTVTANPYRRIFASYSHRDGTIVEELERHARALGDRYLRDVVALRSGEVWSDRLLDLIRSADVF